MSEKMLTSVNVSPKAKQPAAPSGGVGSERAAIRRAGPPPAAVKMTVRPPKETTSDGALSGFVAATDALHAVAQRLASRGMWPPCSPDDHLPAADNRQRFETDGKTPGLRCDEVQDQG